MSGSPGRPSNSGYQYTLAWRRHRRALRVGAQDRSGAQKSAAADRRQFRPAARGARGQSDHRPGHRGAPRAHRRPDRQHALRRLWAAAGIGDLQGAEPVPRRDGGGARVPAIARDIEPDLCQHRRRCGQRHAANPTLVRHRGGQAAAHEERQRRRERGAERRRRRPATRPTMRSPIPVAASHRPAPPSAPPRKQWCRSPPSAVLAQAIRRSRSITTICSPPRRSRSIWHPACRSARRRRRSTTGSPASACRPRSTAVSRGRPRRFSSRSPTSPC